MKRGLLIAVTAIVSLVLFFGGKQTALADGVTICSNNPARSLPACLRGNLGSPYIPIETLEAAGMVPYYPGFFITTDKTVYRPNETVRMTVTRADGRTDPFLIDWYVRGPTDRILYSLNKLVIYDTLQLPLDLPYVANDTGSYTLLVCSSKEGCSSPNATNSTSIWVYDAVRPPDYSAWTVVDEKIIYTPPTTAILANGARYFHQEALKTKLLDNPATARYPDAILTESFSISENLTASLKERTLLVWHDDELASFFRSPPNTNGSTNWLPMNYFPHWELMVLLNLDGNTIDYGFAIVNVIYN